MPRLKSQTAQILEAVQGLTSRIENLEKNKLEPEVKRTLTQTTENKVEVTEPISSPVPHEFRVIVNEILNPAFDVRVFYDMPGVFDFQVIVPEKYRTVPPDYIKMNHEEMHRKIIPINEGVNGVRSYCELMFRGYNPDMQALIVADRFK